MTKSKASDIEEVEHRWIHPQPGGQTRFLKSSAFEVLFGGSAGPGKSWSMVLDALGMQYEYYPEGKWAIHYPEYRAVIFRTEASDLENLIAKSHDYYAEYGGTFSMTRSGEPGPSWRWDSGAKIFFCQLKYDTDLESHTGPEYQYVGFDEVTQFNPRHYLYMFSRCRSTVMGLRPRLRATTNPVGRHLVFYRKRFIEPMPPGTLGYFTTSVDPLENPAGVLVPAGTPYSLSRQFIPGKLAENKILMEQDPGYTSRIMALGGQMTRALLDGDWYAFGGDFFNLDRNKQIIKPFAIPTEWRLGLGVDPGYSSPCAAVLKAQDYDGNLYTISTYYRKNQNPAQNAKGVKEFIQSCPFTGGRMPEVIVADPSAWAKRDRYAIINTERTFASEFEAQGIYMQQAHNDRIQGWWVTKGLIPDHMYIFSHKAPDVDGLNKALVDEFTGAVADDNDPEDIAGKGNDPDVADHAIDADRYLNMAMYKASPIQPEKPQWMAEFMKRAKGTKAHRVGEA